ncbi:uncharacterized protein LOC131042668 isoform X1 [Cryptomeria japonica]|uniref:uncharacterized protein LOC131042668 isoform X1 n=2 Tax=Cryptomeria japonica TaxID=3369 RepID=UPI0027DA787F|nr:uncharacterized protein LOC131042668 isoform X1 [Cryptomeria japonica]XP_057831975.2 uncharacterized protein LOC131042668 isoform X1 [Cryptomeria japonica]
MTTIEGVGDEVVYVAIFISTFAFLYRTYLWNFFLNLGRQVVNVIRTCFQCVWNGIGLQHLYPRIESSQATSAGHEGFLRRMDSPPENDCCSVCHDSFVLPCQANCAHWFCGECILRVWHHSSAIQPCKCPICRRPINLLIPCESATRRRSEPEVDNILNKIERYNRIFGGGSVGFFQRLRDMPLLLRRLSRELMDPQRALPLVFRARVMLSFALVAVYIFSPVDILPEGILGIVGLLDDLLIVLIVFFHVATLYRSTLFYRHGGRGQ